MIQFTKEQAIEFHDSGAWESLTPAERGIFQLHQTCLCMPFSVFHEGVEAALGRPVWTHEFVEPDRLIAEFEGKTAKPSLEDIINLIPEEKRVVLFG